jgi:acetyl esterase/lipase
VGWVYLVVSVAGAAFTLNALRPVRRWSLLVPGFFAGWLTSELPAHLLLWQLVATLAFAAFGALAAWPGWVGLGISLVSWIGLFSVRALATRATRVLDACLREGLGEGFEQRVLPGLEPGPVSRPLLRRLMPMWMRDPRVERITNVRYAEGAGRRHLLDIYRGHSAERRAAPERGAGGGASEPWRAEPPRKDAAGPRPVLLQIHGGAWILGDKSQQGLPLMLHLAASGWICVAINYRLSPRSTFPDHLIDCKLALRWIREHIAEYGGDPDFVAVTGGSAGGHLASLVALTANDPRYQPGFEGVDTSVQACVPFYGVYDFTNRRGFREPADPLATLVSKRVLKTSIAEDPAAYERASPMSYVRADAPPFLVIHGDSDVLAPVEEAREFARTLRAASRQPVLYAEIPGAHHAFEIFHSTRAHLVVTAVHRFLAAVLCAARGTRSFPTNAAAPKELGAPSVEPEPIAT